MRFILSIILLIACQLNTYAQNTAIGSWRTHMPYQQAIEVLESGNQLYGICKSGIFTFNLQDSTFQTITKIDGLSDVVIKTAAIDKPSGTVIYTRIYTNRFYAN